MSRNKDNTYKDNTYGSAFSILDMELRSCLAVGGENIAVCVYGSTSPEGKKCGGKLSKTFPCPVKKAIVIEARFVNIPEEFTITFCKFCEVFVFLKISSSALHGMENTEDLPISVKSGFWGLDSSKLF